MSVRLLKNPLVVRQHLLFNKCPGLNGAKAVMLMALMVLNPGCSEVPDDADNANKTAADTNGGAIDLSDESCPCAEQTQEDAAGEESDFAGVRSVNELNIVNSKLEEVLTGLEYPWAFEFIDANEVLITEKRGVLSRYNIDTGELTSISGLPSIATSEPQTGLLDVELHPGFDANRRIYFSYVIGDEASGEYYLTAVETAVLGRDRLESHRTILRAEPFGWSPSNFGGALEFDREGYLYITVGDRSERGMAQDPARLQGKVLRLNDDGSVPTDNPFVGVDGYDARIYALGVRNPQGLHYDPESGLLFAAEHGPRGGDEVNIIQAGKNYGWPEITYGANYTMAEIGTGTHKAGMQQPLFYYLPSIATSPLTVYRGSMFKQWEGDILVGALKAKHISKLDFDDGLIRSEHAMLGEIDSRIRDIKVAPDGALFVLAENGTLYRLTRESAPKPEARKVSGQAVYEVVCSGCHETGAYDAPQPGATTEWQAIRARPRETTYRRTLEGFGSMPERGLCYLCSDDEIKQAVDYMLSRAESESGE